MATTTNPAVTARTISAECRFVEEGHRVRFDAVQHCFLVRSDSRPVDYHITVSAQGQACAGIATALLVVGLATTLR